MEEQARLVNIENDRNITKESDAQFWFEYQRWLLLALKDKGVLTETQYRYAEKTLKKQRAASFLSKTVDNTVEEGRETT